MVFLLIILVTGNRKTEARRSSRGPCLRPPHPLPGRGRSASEGGSGAHARPQSGGSLCTGPWCGRDGGAGPAPSAWPPRCPGAETSVCPVLPLLVLLILLLVGTLGTEPLHLLRRGGHYSNTGPTQQKKPTKVSDKQALLIYIFFFYVLT